MASKSAVRVLLAVRDVGLGQNLSVALDELGYTVFPAQEEAEAASKQPDEAAPNLLIIDLDGKECGEALAERLLSLINSEEYLNRGLCYRELLESAQMAAVVLDRQARIRYCNDYFADLVEQPKEAVIGADWFSCFVPEGDLTARKNLLSTIMENKEKRSTNESRLKTATGVIRQIQWETAQLRDAKGEVIGLAAFGRDISELRNLEERFMQAQKMESVGRLAGSVAHDFNNLLTGIQGNVSLALMELREEDPLYDVLREASKAAESATDLTRQLLAFTRKQTPNPRVVDVNEVIRDFQKILARLLGKEVEIVTDFCTEAAQVRIDPGQLQQVLINLAVNARDAMPNGGHLTISTKCVWRRAEIGLAQGSYLHLSLSDEGCGMSQEVRRHLFEPFFTTKERGKGTGLGLSTVHGIIKQHNGHIEVRSEERAGTCFDIFLPREGREAKALKADFPGDALPGGKETLWLVEHEALVREPAADLLRHLGYKVRVFKNHDAVLKALNESEEEVDLLLTDIKDRDRSLAGEVQSLRPAVKVLYTSEYLHSLVNAQDTPAHGSPHFLSNPFTLHSLSRKLREVLES